MRNSDIKLLVESKNFRIEDLGSDGMGRPYVQEVIKKGSRVFGLDYNQKGLEIDPFGDIVARYDIQVIKNSCGYSVAILGGVE
tara:strand:- start:214 stop:462 length:249 start_codon:yes stop_codon:yes gene_type:complete